MRPLPPTAALALVALGGVASAAQGVINAEFGAQAGGPVLGAVVNNLGGSMLVLVGLLAWPSMRAGLRALPTARLPWWSYLGGLGGAAIVVIATYAVPVLGAAAFTIAQVVGGSLGGLAVDRVGLGPVGRLPLTVSRIGGALLGLAAVTLAQFGRPLGELALGPVLLAVVGGLAVAMQAALNGRVSAVVGTGAGTAVNFAVGTLGVLAVAVVVGALSRLPANWPGDWYLWIGGLLGVTIVTALLVGVRSVGVLRTGLVLVGGQLVGSLLLDTLLPGGAGLRLPVLIGAVLTLLAAVVAGRGDRPRGPLPAAVLPGPRTGGVTSGRSPGAGRRH
ncbi:transporter family-2 protein [Micromonospora pallida]|uniref:Transporter family-2 protein n=1 Tax=Micromonospora pallida TaxID=145854 RepID=A0A1C6SLV3_9ACTN|nr:DMT family transporter [Micromonospora pallida]SCL30388.1 transporter family-2 protein [Micromonospora pallida]